jgi:hypothetical protein
MGGSHSCFPAVFHKQPETDNLPGAENENAAAVAVAQQFEQERRQEEAAAELAADKAAAQGQLRGYLPGDEPPCTQAFKSSNTYSMAVKLYDAQVGAAQMPGINACPLTMLESKGCNIE